MSQSFPDSVFPARGTTSTSHADLADLIRSVRHAAGWTQSELAAKAGIALMSVSAAENGRNARWETLTSIAHAFGFETFIELCRAGEYSLQTEQTRTLLRVWDALPSDEARETALNLIAAELVKPQKLQKSPKPKRSLSR